MGKTCSLIALVLVLSTAATAQHQVLVSPDEEIIPIGLGASPGTGGIPVDRPERSIGFPAGR